MRRRLVLLLATVTLSCGPSPASVPAASPSATAAPSASRAAATRLDGTVQSASASRLVLADGTSIDLTQNTRITRTDRATAADLRTGSFVAITAKQQQDGSLLASMVNIFSASLSRSVPPGQRPLPQGDLMTNAAIAAIDQVSGTSFTVTFGGQTVKVILAPTATVTKQVDLAPADLVPGAKVTVTVSSGVAQSVQIQTQ